MKKTVEKILDKLPREYSQIILRQGATQLATCEELRFRKGQEISIKSLGKEYFLEGFKTKEEDLQRLLEHFTDYSVHSAMESLKNGFITISGGHRVGVCGNLVMQDDKKQTMKDVSSLNIRVAEEYLGIADPFIDSFLEKSNNLLIISPPSLGKTTLLRDFIRSLANRGYTVGVSDERGELSGDFRFSLGRASDVIVGGRKKDNVQMLLRTMSPLFIAVDEITEDSEFLEEISACGAGILATIHGNSLAELGEKNILRHFSMILRIDRTNRSYIRER